ncbi:MAG TPA: hypothetical protein VEK08_24055 [Planctomycetota bacterium]|nr:hypothetical protein [Planctomycetota bacterium]
MATLFLDLPSLQNLLRRYGVELSPAGDGELNLRQRQMGLALFIKSLNLSGDVKLNGMTVNIKDIELQPDGAHVHFAIR